MRKALVQALIELAEKDPRLVLLTADLGYTVLEPFADRFPARFFNVGVAEQNMIGLATGLADGGFIPYVYSIATFAALRPFEFIRNGPVLQRLPVRIIGVGGGYEYDHAGPTHYALEDVGALRMLPGLHVIAPADAGQCRAAILATHAIQGPAYLRLGKDEAYAVPGLDARYAPGRAHLVREGHDALLIALGPAAALACRAADLLAAQNFSIAVMVVASVSPAPEDDLRAALSRFPCAVTVEGHYATGGVGSLVCEVAATHNIDCRIRRLGVTRLPTGPQGKQEYMHQAHGMSPDQIAAAVMESLAISAGKPGRRAGSDWGAAPGRALQGSVQVTSSESPESGAAPPGRA